MPHVSGLYGVTTLYRHIMSLIPGAAEHQVMGVATQGARVLTMVRCRGIHAVSSYIVHDTDSFVPVGQEFVVFPLTDDWALQMAGMRRVHSVAVNSTTKIEGLLFTFPWMWCFLIWGIACGWGASRVILGRMVGGVGLKRAV